MLLTIEQLQSLPPHEIFAKGKTKIDHPMEKRKVKVKWVAVRGGIADWAIYTGTECEDEQFIKMYGSKVYSEAMIRKLVPCEDSAYLSYRL